MNRSRSDSKCWLRRTLSAAFLGMIAAAFGCSTMSLEGPDDPAGELSSLLHQLENLNGEQNYGESSKRNLARLAVKYPNDVDIHFANAVYAARDEDTARAALHLDALFRITFVHPEAAVLRAKLALKEGNLRLAVRLLDEQIRLVPDHPGLREVLGSAYYFQAKYKAAGVELQHALRLGAPRWRVAYHQGLVAEAEGRSEDAQGLYEDSTRLNPDFRPAASRARALNGPVE